MAAFRTMQQSLPNKSKSTWQSAHRLQGAYKHMQSIHTICEVTSTITTRICKSTNISHFLTRTIKNIRQKVTLTLHTVTVLDTNPACIMMFTISSTNIDHFLLYSLAMRTRNKRRTMERWTRRRTICRRT